MHNSIYSPWLLCMATKRTLCFNMINYTNGAKAQIAPYYWCVSSAVVCVTDKTVGKDAS